MLEIEYSLLRPDLEVPESLKCDTYKVETHAVTGKFTLYCYAVHGSTSHLSTAISGVVYFRVKRPA